MNVLRHAAASLLEQLREQPTAAARVERTAQAETSGVRIERLTCEARDPYGSELVSLRLDAGRLQVVCTCARQGCAHVYAALQLVAATPADAEAPRLAASGAEHTLVEARASQPLPALTRAVQLSEALADVVTAVVRAGVCSDRVASVRETLARVERVLPKPLPLGLLRWLGRIHEAIDAKDTALAAQALCAAALLSSDLRDPQPSAAAGARLASWFGGDTGLPVQRMSDRTLLEVAREWVNGSTRNQIERRYLIDLDSGESFREECARAESSSSIGSCPRLIGVSLAEVEGGCRPRRLRLLQYTTTPSVERTHWDNLAAWGQRDSEALLTAYRSALVDFGALAEPFALIAPCGLRTEGALSLVCDRGAPVPLIEEDEPGLLKRCQRLLSSQKAVWVAGRLLDRGGQLMLKPLAVGWLGAASIRHERL